jgi:hypothetical protein
LYSEGSATYATSEADSGQLLFTCTGPDARGACGRVAIGEVVACARKALSRLDGNDEAYLVPCQMTLCPMTLLQSVAVPAESSLLPPAYVPWERFADPPAGAQVRRASALAA